MKFAYRGLWKVISGGQCGGDAGGLAAAFDAGLVTGGHCPADWRTDRGPQPLLKQFGLVCTASPDYPDRTRLNIKNSDGTIIFGRNFGSPGTILTWNECKKTGKPVMKVSTDIGSSELFGDNIQQTIYNIVDFIKDNQISVLNVAGNRDKGLSTEVHDMTHLFLDATFQGLDELNLLIRDSDL